MAGARLFASRWPRLPWYRLDANGEPVLCPDGKLPTDEEWRHNTLAREEVTPGVVVSTTFVFFDHGTGWYVAIDDYRPVLWETMVFGGSLDGMCERYCSKAEALAGHASIVAQVKDREGVFEHERAIHFD